MLVFNESTQNWMDISDSSYDEFKFIQELRELPEEETKYVIEEFIDDNDDLSENIINFLRDEFSLEIENVFNTVYLFEGYFFIKDDDNVYSKWCREDELSSVIDSLYDYEILKLLGVEEDDVYLDGWEGRIKEIQSSPLVVYHYTNEDSWERIQESGELRGSYGTSLSNRGSRGVFTSFDPEEYAIGSYGNICLKIDLGKFKEDLSLDRLEVYPEPEVFEVEIKNQLISKLSNNYIPFEVSFSNGVSNLTVIVDHDIPVEYIEAINI
jgi:hypothetical protein